MDLQKEEKNLKEELNVYFLILKFILKMVLKLAKFSLYLALYLLQMLINLLDSIFLGEYDPIGKLELEKEKRKKIEMENYIQENKKTKISIKHTYVYEFTRNEVFNENYNTVTSRINQVAQVDLRLNQELAEDTINRINLMLTESEKQALKDGYNYAKETKFKLSEDEIYPKFIENKALKGE